MGQKFSSLGVMEAENHSKNSAMEAENHVKHGRSVTSQKGRRNFFRKACFGLLAAVVITLSINACSGVSEQSERWEYLLRWVDINDRGRTENELNELGRDGWELVATAGGSSNHFVFKRRLP